MSHTHTHTHIYTHVMSHTHTHTHTCVYTHVVVVCYDARNTMKTATSLVARIGVVRVELGNSLSVLFNCMDREHTQSLVECHWREVNVF